MQDRPCQHIISTCLNFKPFHIVILLAILSKSKFFHSKNLNSLNSIEKINQYSRKFLLILLESSRDPPDPLSQYSDRNQNQRNGQKNDQTQLPRKDKTNTQCRQNFERRLKIINDH